MKTTNSITRSLVEQSDSQKTPNLWGYRIYNDKSAELYKLFKKENYLRQGWGYKSEHDLKLNPKDKAVARNKEILKKLKKGDYIVVAHFPSTNKVCIAKATEDADKGYVFEQTNIPGCGTENDFGHMFPAEEICLVEYSTLKDILKCRRRFWRLNTAPNRILSIVKGYK